MRKLFVHLLFAAVLSLIASADEARAKLVFTPDETDSGIRYVTVAGNFEHDDDLSAFTRLVARHRPAVVLFQSPGGNLYKAMDLGRLIRAFDLDTLQPRGLDCASSCALAFFGGVNRMAEAGAIGVHKSSFSGHHGLDTESAVSAVQEATADVIAYMTEMGVDPSLLQLALRYDSDDIRYLSKSEMARFRVTTTRPLAGRRGNRRAAATSSSAGDETSLSIPRPRSGKVRHPGGSARLKAGPDFKSADISRLPNTTPVTILDGDDRWYRVRAGYQTGYMHSTWVKVDQYEASAFSQRYVQIKSFDRLSDARSYVRASPIPLAAHLANNGWIAITLRDTFDRRTALALLRELKEKGAVPADSFVTFGNTYVRKVCCD